MNGMVISIIYNDKTERITKMIDDIVDLLNGVQKYFHFVKKTTDVFKDSVIDWKSFSRRYKQTDLYEIHITDFPFYDNYFSHENHNYSVITVNGWEENFYPPSLKSYVMYQIAQAAMVFEAELSERVISSMEHQEARGCMFDFCGNKSDIKLGINSGIICDDCIEQLRRYNVEENAIRAIKTILYYVRKEAETVNKKSVDIVDKKKQEKKYMKSDNKNIFIVHGHTNDLKYQVSNLLRKIGLNPIILSEQTHSCRSIMEEIERHGNRASAAVVLFTPDDFGNVKTAEEKNPRARQNVVLEAGYFMGLLGRDKVILVKSDNSIEMPSDLGGILYSETSEFQIARELRDMGLDVDLNNL